MNKILRKQSRKGFSLVELLAVVLVLAVLAAVAIPLYTSQRQSAAARTCKANLAAISSALSAWALRNNEYPTPVSSSVFGAYVATGTTSAAKGGLIGAPEGLTQSVKCPLGGDYTVTGGGTAAIVVTCPSAVAHGSYGTGPWVVTLAAPAGDNLP